MLISKHDNSHDKIEDMILDKEFQQLIANPKELSGKFVSNHWREYVKPKYDKQIYLPTKRPVTILTAGCTGAGKTEFSRSLLMKEEELFHATHKSNNAQYPKYVIADADDFYLELREKYHFTKDLRTKLNFVCIKFVERLTDHAIKNDQNLLIDSSFSTEKSLKNISRSLKHNRAVKVFYIFEQPQKAWYYTKAREQREGRKVSKEFFAKTYVGSREMINRARKEFGNQITFQPLQKAEDNQYGSNYSFIPIDRQSTGVDKIIEQSYNIDDILRMIK